MGSTLATWPLLWCKTELLRGHISCFIVFGSSQGSASACQALEVGPAASARSFSGVTQAWSAEVSPTPVPALPAPLGDDPVGCGHPLCAGTLLGAAPPVTPASVRTSLGNGGEGMAGSVPAVLVSLGMGSAGARPGACLVYIISCRTLIWGETF